MIERWDLLFALNEERLNILKKSKHVLFVKKLWHTIERGNLLFAVMQITSSQCWTRWTLTSEYPDCHILFWNKLRTIVFVNLRRRSRTTLTDNLFQRDLQQNNVYNPFSEKSKKMIKESGNVELFWIVRDRTWNAMQRVLIVLEFRHHLLHLRASWKKVKQTEAPFNVHWSFSQFQIMSLRRNDLMATDMGKLQHKESIMLPITWERDASRGIFKGSTIVLWTILNFVHLNSNMIEMKRSVSRWMSLRKKIADIIWRKQNTLDTEGIGGFLSIMTEHLDDWKIFLTSTRRCPHYTIYTKNLENDNSGQYHSGSINTGTPPVGGNGAIPGGAHNNLNESPTKRHDRTVKLVVCRLWIKPQTYDFSRFVLILLQLDRLQLTAVCCNRRGV